MDKVIIASGPVIIEEGKVLLAQHGTDDFWKFCGGRVESNEISLVETAKREVREEMGVEIEIIKSEPFLLHTVKETGDARIDVVLVHYLAKRSGEIRPGSDIRKWGWISLADLPKEHLAPNILPTLRHFGFIK